MDLGGGGYWNGMTLFSSFITGVFHNRFLHIWIFTFFILLGAEGNEEEARQWVADDSADKFAAVAQV